MSNTKIKQAGEIHLVALAPGFPSAWENVNFKPPVGPYQIPTWAFADPDDRGNKDAPYLQRGIFTVTLAYPTNQGGGAAQAKAEAIKDWFKKGTTIPAETFNLIIDREPEITGGRIEETRYIIRVLIRFFAWIDRHFDSTSNYLLPVLSIGLPQVQIEGNDVELINGLEW